MRYDLDLDGDVDAADSSRASTTFQGTTLSWGVLTNSAVGNRKGYAGYEYDEAVSKYHVRNRILDPALGRWTRRDPLPSENGIIFHNIQISRLTSNTIISVNYEKVDPVNFGPGLGGRSGGQQVATCPLVDKLRPAVLSGNLNTFQNTSILINLVQYVDSSPIPSSDPSGLCPPTPACGVPGSFSPGCTGNWANCKFYLPNSPYEFSVCMSVGNGRWKNCVRGCLQRCKCAHPWWCRESGIVFLICHNDCFKGCKSPSGPLW